MEYLCVWNNTSQRIVCIRVISQNTYSEPYHKPTEPIGKRKLEVTESAILN